MANKSFVSDYVQLNTIPALSGVLFAVAAAVQFLGANVSLAVPSYTFDPAHALLVSLGVLVIAFASSDTNDWREYEAYEQGVVAAAVVVMVGSEYTTFIGDLVSTTSPLMAGGAFALSMVAWGVLAR